MKKNLLLVLLAIFSASNLSAQTADTSAAPLPRMSPPVPIEAYADDKGVLFQMIVTKHFSPTSKFGFFNVTEFYGDYAVTNQHNRFVAQSFLTADIWKGLALNAGGSINHLTGFRPSAGLQYVFVNKKILALVLPRFDLTQTHNFEAFGLVEYKPKFSKNWGLYTRAQWLYNHNTERGFHELSYIRLRVGASYKNYHFGLGSNTAFYGPNKVNDNSFGVFVRADLF